MESPGGRGCGQLELIVCAIDRHLGAFLQSLVGVEAEVGARSEIEKLPSSHRDVSRIEVVVFDANAHQPRVASGKGVTLKEG